jgi:hypothetical protein
MNNYRRHSFELKPLLEKRHEVAKTIGLKKKHACWIYIYLNFMLFIFKLLSSLIFKNMFNYSFFGKISYILL